MNSQSGIINTIELERQRNQEDIVYRLNRGLGERRNLRKLGYPDCRAELLGYLTFLGYEHPNQEGFIRLPSGDYMDKSRAKEILSHCLVVGNPRQIDALHVLEILICN
ncbi:MAG: hypothetical protein AABX54_04860 [Nanoarchaeota archaeon]